MFNRFFVGRGEREEPEWIVWLTVVAVVTAGWLYGLNSQNAPQTARVGAGSVTYPSAWVAAPVPGAAFAAADILNGGAFGPRVVVRRVASAELLGPTREDDESGGPFEAATAWSLAGAKSTPGYRLLRIDRAQVGGREAAQVEYAYLADGPQGSAAGAMPALMRAVDTLVPSGDDYAILTFAAEAGRFGELAGLQQRLLADWRPG